MLLKFKTVIEDRVLLSEVVDLRFDAVGELLTFFEEDVVLLSVFIFLEEILNLLEFLFVKDELTQQFEDLLCIFSLVKECKNICQTNACIAV